MLAVHLDGTFFCTREALRLMSRVNRGAIVNLSSVAALAGLEACRTTARRRAASSAFTRAVARDVGSRGIRVNAICPGLHRHADDRPGSPLIRAKVIEPHAARALGRAAGGRGHGALPGVRRQLVLHRASGSRRTVASSSVADGSTRGGVQHLASAAPPVQMLQDGAGPPTPVPARRRRRRALARVPGAPRRATSACASRAIPATAARPRAEWIEHISDLAFHYLDLLDGWGSRASHLVGRLLRRLDRGGDRGDGVAPPGVARADRPGRHQGGRLDLSLPVRHGHPGDRGDGLPRTRWRRSPWRRPTSRSRRWPSSTGRAPRWRA